MSYCRFGEDSDIYLYPHVYGDYICCACRLRGTFGSTVLITLAEVLEHLQAHRDVGHKVPEYAFERIRTEIEELGPEYDNSLTEEDEEELKRIKAELERILDDYKREGECDGV